jgi:hypothetical protein
MPGLHHNYTCHTQMFLIMNRTSLQFLLCFLLASAMSTNAVSQPCNCAENFEWMKKTFEENDAGFSYVLKQKGVESYSNWNHIMKAKIEGIKDYVECRKQLNLWLSYFRRGHIGVSFTDSIYKLVDSVQLRKLQTQPPPSAETIQNHERVNIDEEEFRNYLKTSGSISFEGIWKSPPYLIGIKKTGESYTGFVIDAPGTPWKKQQVKIKIFPTPQGFKGTNYFRDFSKADSVNVDTTWFGSSMMSVGPMTWERVYPLSKDSTVSREFITALSSDRPFIRNISPGVLYLRIPGFAIAQKKWIDSILNANHKLIVQSRHLVIDVRQNGGGADASYAGLLKYLYTDPIISISAELLSTPLNNASLLDVSENNGFNIEDRARFRSEYETLSAHPGEFVVRGDRVSTLRLDRVFQNPRKVSILINNGCASSTEEFLLAARQSRKVKLYGASTFGSLDMSNMNAVSSPTNEFELAYATSRSLRIPQLPIDGAGVQPDIFIPQSVPQSKWLSYVLSLDSR